MNKKIFAAILLVACLIGVAAAALYKEYVIPQQATVGEVALAITIEGTLWEGATIDWGTNLAPEDVITYTLVIENIGTTTCALSMTTPDIPLGWTQTMTLNTYTIAVGEFATGDLTLTVATDAISSTYNWDTIIRGDQA